MTEQKKQLIIKDNTMSDTKKAKEISESFYMPDTGFNREDMCDAAMEMAKWKDEQLKDYLERCIKTCEKSKVPQTKIVFESMIKELEL